MVDNDPYDGDDDDDAVGFEDDDVDDAEYNDYDEALDENPDEEGKWAAGLNVLLGLGLIATPFVLDWLITTGVWTTDLFGESIAGNAWNDVIIGAGIAALAAYNYYRAANEEEISTGAASLVALLGLWMIVAPFVFEPTTEVGFWYDVVVGALVAILAGYNVYTARDVETTTPTGT